MSFTGVVPLLMFSWILPASTKTVKCRRTDPLERRTDLTPPGRRPARRAQIVDRPAAATRNLGERVEIRIRDNGTGIPADVREKLFNPFFTTKPAGEGTGLGLSISHDIVVKQHAGSIDIETQSGQFTEFRIVLPRAGMAINSGERR
jgi:signal transduction histidine kinase